METEELELERDRAEAREKREDTRDGEAAEGKRIPIPQMMPSMRRISFNVLPGVSTGMRVDVPGKGRGTVRYVGPSLTTTVERRIGIELDLVSE